jgi:hypothetical protein
LAHVTLSGIIQCSEKAVEPILLPFYELLKQSKIPKEKGETYNKIIAKRHAAVLGIAAVIRAFPYELPKWMPKALVILSESSNDPAPIRSTITETFGEFKRTHQDDWETHKQKFTSDELYAVSDLLLSQNYFA